MSGAWRQEQPGVARVAGERGQVAAGQDRELAPGGGPRAGLIGLTDGTAATATETGTGGARARELRLPLRRPSSP